jgi:hypothetical protein
VHIFVPFSEQRIFLEGKAMIWGRISAWMAVPE